MTSRLALIAIGVSALFAVGAVNPGLTHAQSKCAGNKQKLAGKKASSKLKCWAKGVKSGVQANAICLSKATSKFNSKWDKTEAKGGCTTTGDKTTIENKVDAFVDDVVDELAGSPAGAILTTDPARRCAASKIKSAGSKASAKLKCTGKAAQLGGPPNSLCLSKATGKFSSKWDKAEAKGGCATTGDKTTLENKVDAFVTDTASEIPGSPSTTTTTTATTTTQSSTTTTSPISACCGSVRIVTTSSQGTLQVSALPAFAFPANVQTVVEVGPPTAFPGCMHTGVVPAGGFTVPVFCIPGLMYTSQVTALGCESGGGDGQAALWDSGASMSDPIVTRIGDTSDGVCDPGGACTTAGAGNNTTGNINTTRGGSPSHTGFVDTQVDIPVNSLTWQSATFTCPDADGMFSAGDTIITNFDFILSPTTGATSATFTDMNGDLCSRAGVGPDSMTDHGTAAPGPCCSVGQSTTVAATGIAFTGAAPLYDITFRSVTPTTVSSCSAPVSTDTCTLTTDPCKD